MELWGDPRVTRYLGGPFTPDQVRDKLASEIDTQRAHGFQYWPFFLLGDDRHVGCAGLRPYKGQDVAHELGFHLRPEYWGMGLAFEAATAVIRYAFNILGVDALFAGHIPEHDASRVVLIKLGFVYSGMEVYPRSGILEPTYLLRKSPVST